MEKKSKSKSLKKEIKSIKSVEKVNHDYPTSSLTTFQEIVIYFFVIFACLGLFANFSLLSINQKLNSVYTISSTIKPKTVADINKELDKILKEEGLYGFGWRGTSKNLDTARITKFDKDKHEINSFEIDRHKRIPHSGHQQVPINPDELKSLNKFQDRILSKMFPCPVENKKEEKKGE